MNTQEFSLKKIQLEISRVRPLARSGSLVVEIRSESYKMVMVFSGNMQKNINQFSLRVV